MFTDGTSNLTSTGILGVAQGGTSVGTFTTNGVLYGNGNTNILATGVGGAGTVLHGTGAAPTFSAVSLSTDIAGVLPIANGGTNGAAPPTAGAVAY